MKHFCIVANRSKEGIEELVLKLKNYIENNSGTCFVAETMGKKGKYTYANDIPADTECVLVLGGDGTFLQTSKDLEKLDLPLFGINMGSLGFLTMTEAGNAENAVAELMNDNYTIDYRMKIKVSSNDGKSADALNDVVISRGGYSHLVGVTVYVNDQLFGMYEGDGIIISTPTGSTGYNLSAGGPIVKPQVGAILVTPICPHALNARSFVISAEDVVKIRLKGYRHETSDEAYVTVDGEEYCKLMPDEELVIAKSEMNCKMCMLPSFSFADMLNTKLT